VSVHTRKLLAYHKLNQMKLKPGLAALYATQPGHGQGGLVYSSHGLAGNHSFASANMLLSQRFHGKMCMMKRHHFNVRMLPMICRAGRSRDAPSRTASRTWADELLRRCFSLGTNDFSLTTDRMSAILWTLPSVASIKVCHSSSLSASCTHYDCNV